FVGTDVATIFKGMQLEIGAPPQFMDLRYHVEDAHHGGFHLDHCGALLDVEPMGETHVRAMCHDIEDPTFDATAGAPGPRAPGRTVPPRARAAGRSPPPPRTPGPPRPPPCPRSPPPPPPPSTCPPPPPPMPEPRTTAARSCPTSTSAPSRTRRWCGS